MKLIRCASLVMLLASSCGDGHSSPPHRNAPQSQECSAPGLPGAFHGALQTFRSPTALAVDGQDRIFVAETSANQVSVLDPDGKTHVIAGSGVAGDSGDGGAAVHARLNHPAGLAVWRNSLLISDTHNHRLRRVTEAGLIVPFAGTGRRGFGGDGGLASDARFDSPTGLWVAQDVVFVADTSNNRVRRIGTNAKITTLAGTGRPGYTGEGDAASPTNRRATKAELNHPTAVAGDDQTLYIADTGNNRVRVLREEVDTGRGVNYTPERYMVIDTLVGPGHLSRPSGLALLGGEAVVADTGHDRVLMAGSPSEVGLIAGRGAASSREIGTDLGEPLSAPRGLAVDAGANLFMADTGHGRLRRFHLLVGCM